MTPRVLGIPIAPKRNLPVVGLTQTGMAAARISNPILRDIMLTWVASNEAMARDVMSGLIDKNTKMFGGTAHTRELLKELASEIHSDKLFENPDVIKPILTEISLIFCSQYHLPFVNPKVLLAL